MIAIMYHLKCTREEALHFLTELESSGRVKRVGNDWVRVEVGKIHEPSELNRRGYFSCE